MSEILFVTTRNIYSMCGELQLIRNRSLALKNEFNIETQFYGLISTDKQKLPQQELYTGKADFTFFKMNPLGFIKGYRVLVRKVIEALKNSNYSAVVISGAFPFNIAKRIKKSVNIYTVYDSHGVWEELIEFKPSLKRKMRYLFFKANEKATLKYCDGIFAVTGELKDYHNKNYGWNKNSFIVPCALSKGEFSVEEALAFRKKWREKLGINDNEVLFIYSGGLSPWQSIDKAYEIFLKYKKEKGNARFLIMTPNKDGLDYPEATIMSFPSKEVSEVLFAGDVAFLIREDFVTNHVAFPNKYLEYVLSNMLIISTPYLKDISKEIKEKHLGIIIEKTDDFSSFELENVLKTKGTFEENYNLRKEITESHGFSQTLKGFAKKIDETIDK